MRWPKMPSTPSNRQLATRLSATTAVMAALALLIAGCSSAKSDNKSEQLSAGPIALAVADAPIWKPIVAGWNSAHPDQPVSLTELPMDASARSDKVVESLQNHASGYDVVVTDSSATAELAAAHWIAPLQGALALDSSGLVKPAVAGATYKSVPYAAPLTADSGVLYYRSDLLKKAPTNWAAISSDCSVATTAGLACYSGQYAEGSDLATNAIEAIYQSGGRVLTPQGTAAAIDTPAAEAGLQFLVNSYAKQVIPAAAITYQRAQSERAFASGSLLMLRSDPEAYPQFSAKTSAVGGKFKVAALPGPSGGAAAPFGGLAATVNASGAHQKTAHDFIAYLQSATAQQELLTAGNMAPALTSLYSDAALRAKYPFLAALQSGWATGQPLPVSPAYEALSDAIADNVYDALTGAKKVPQVAQDLQAEINGLALQ